MTANSSVIPKDRSLDNRGRILLQRPGIVTRKYETCIHVTKREREAGALVCFYSGEVGK